LHEDLGIFMIVPRWILLRTRNVSDNSCRENQNTHFMFSDFFPKIMSSSVDKNVGEPVRPRMII